MTVMTTQTRHVKGKKPYKSWVKDGVDGPSSMDVLIDWLSHKPNYKRWKQEDYSMDRVPKKELLGEIINKLKSVGIYHREPKDIASKISTLQSNYKYTKRWNDTEGNRLRHIGVNEKAIHDEIIKRFPYWDNLHPVYSGNAVMDIKSILQPTSQQDKIHALIQNSRKKETEKAKKAQELLYTLRNNKTHINKTLVEEEHLAATDQLIKYLRIASFSEEEVHEQLQKI
ncbi:hypothetical protein K501DRAFT_271440 [Backusella circina FSU 941]|nr:hypothetical protein K501DRAFT_271440 [Backusella circina FSU 941]